MKTIIFFLIILLTSCQQQSLPPEVNEPIKADPRDIPSITFSQGPILIEYGTKNVDTSQWVVSGYFLEIDYPQVDFSIVGSQQLIYRLSGHKMDVEELLKIHVVDTQFPVFVDDINMIDINQGQTIDLSQFKAMDPIDGELDIVIDSRNFDSNRLLRQRITLTATDKNYNETRKEVFVNVLAVDNQE